jgi:hypothetical protein
LRRGKAGGGGIPIIDLTADGIGSSKEKPLICTAVRKGRQTSLSRPWYLRGSWRNGEAGGVGGGGGGNTRRLQEYSKDPDLTLEDGCLHGLINLFWSYLSHGFYNLNYDIAALLASPSFPRGAAVVDFYLYNCCSRALN